MTELVFLRDFVVIFAVAVGIAFLFHRLHMAPIVGYLLSGILLGPSLFAVVRDTEPIEVMAEIGVILLLFSIGIEFSLEELVRLKRAVFTGGFLQIFLTTATVVLLTHLLDIPLRQGIFFGFLVSLSSTAIVLKVLSERAELEAPHGRLSVAVLIFQDLSIVAMVLLVPLLGSEDSAVIDLMLTILKALILVGVVIIVARVVVPRTLRYVVETRSRELFLLSVVLICFGTAWLTSLVGLSLALGAFLAGLVISESEYGHQAFSEILPLKDLFSILFFVSIGMLLQIDTVIQHPATVLLAVLSVIVIKFTTGSLVPLVLGYPLRIGVLTGISLAQIGEFSFVLSNTGLQHGLIQDETYQVFLASAILTMMFTPFMIHRSHSLSERIEEILPSRTLKTSRLMDEALKREMPENHVVIVGFGLNGRNLSKVLSAAGIPFVVLEMNPETVRIERARGVPIIYGDASKEAVLQQVNIARAQCVVIAISDAAATRRITELARKLNPGTYIIARTRYSSEVEPLYQLGADEVVPEEFETSIEIFSRVLQKYLLPRDEIEQYIREIRQDGYEMFRSPSRDHAFPGLKKHLPEIEIESIRIPPNSPLAGRTLSSLALRQRYNVTVLAIQREGSTITNPGGDTQLLPQDILILMGRREHITQATSLLSEGKS